MKAAIVKSDGMSGTEFGPEGTYYVIVVQNRETKPAMVRQPDGTVLPIMGLLAAGFVSHECAERFARSFGFSL